VWLSWDEIGITGGVLRQVIRSRVEIVRRGLPGGTRWFSPMRSRFRITSNPGETHFSTDDQKTLLREPRVKKTPNEIALNILLAGLTHDLLASGRDASIHLRIYSGAPSKKQSLFLVSLTLVCLIPTTIGGLHVRDRHCRHWGTA